MDAYHRTRLQHETERQARRLRRSSAGRRRRLHSRHHMQGRPCRIREGLEWPASQCVYAETGGPLGGRWFWAVQVAPDGTPFNGGTGHAATGREAREAVEARVPEGILLKRR